MKTLYYLAFCAALPILAKAEDTDKKRPNILFILADDQSPYDLKVYDPKSKLETPMIDKLAAEGMVFDGAHQMGAWSGAVCTPSRHMIMSGRTVWHVPGRIIPEKNAPADLVDFTMASVFNAAGYDTMRTCKKGNSYEAANKKFTIVHDSTMRGVSTSAGKTFPITLLGLPKRFGKTVASVRCITTIRLILSCVRHRQL